MSEGNVTPSEAGKFCKFVTGIARLSAFTCGGCKFRPDKPSKCCISGEILDKYLLKLLKKIAVFRANWLILKGCFVKICQYIVNFSQHGAG